MMDNGLPTNKPVTLKDVEQINKDKHHKNMQNRMHRIDDSYQIPGEKPMSTADKPTSKFTDAMTQVLANEAEIMEKKKVKLDPVGKEDDDVDNDGDTDSSDKYLKTRRKAIGKAIATEETSEPRPGTLAKIIATPGHPLKSSAKRELKYREAEAAAMKKEEVEPLDELSPQTLGSYASKATKDASANIKKIAGAKDRYTGRQFQGRANKRETGADLAIDKIRGNYNVKVHAKEEVEPLAELSKGTLKNYIKKAVGAEAGSNKSLPILAAATGRHSERSQVAVKAGDMDSMRKERDKAGKTFDKSWNRRKGVGMAADKLAKEEVEVNEAATVLLRKGGATKRMRYNPASIERLKREGWVVASEAFVDKVRALFDIAEEITFEDALSLVEAVDEVKRGRGRPKKAVDPNAAPKREWKPGGRGRPPKNKEAVTKVSTSDTKAAGPADKADNEVTDTGHILDHLRKAVSTNGTNSFRQKNGSMSKVSQSAALALLLHHDKLPKASDRFQMQQHLAKSPEHLQNAIKNVAAGKPYNAGYEAKAKAKVSLAAPDWNKKK